MSNCKAYIIKGVNAFNGNIDIFFLKECYKSLVSTTGCIWFSKFILSKKRANEIKELCIKIDPKVQWLVCEVEMSTLIEI